MERRNKTHKTDKGHGVASWGRATCSLTPTRPQPRQHGGRLLGLGLGGLGFGGLRLGSLGLGGRLGRLGLLGRRALLGGGLAVQRERERESAR